MEVYSTTREHRVATIAVSELLGCMRALANFLYNCFESGVVVVCISEGVIEEAPRTGLRDPFTFVFRRFALFLL